jgi:hypothetical protein
MKKLIISIVSVIALSASSFAAQLTTYEGSDVSGQFLGVDVGARSSGMGNAVAAVSEGSEAIFSNPANTVQKKNLGSLFVSHTAYLSDMSLETVAYERGVENLGTFGLGVSYVNEGKLDSYKVVNGSPVSNGTINPYALVVKLNYSTGLILKDLFVGANIDYATENIDKTTDNMVAVDLGVKYAPETLAGIKGLSFGLSARNIGGDLSGYTLYKDILVGAGYQLDIDRSNIVNFGADFGLIYDKHFSTSDQNDFSVGAEYVYAGMYKARVGYQLDKTGTEGLKGLRAGLGIAYNIFSIDYAVEPYGDLGTVHKVSLGANF